MEPFRDKAEDEIERLRQVIAKLEEAKGTRIVRVEIDRKEGYGYCFYITAPTMASEEVFGKMMAETIQGAFKAIGVDVQQDVVGGDHIAPPNEQPGIPENKCYLAKNAFGRWIIVNAMDRTLAWSGLRWVAHENGVPQGAAQVSNFEIRVGALADALAANLDVATVGCLLDGESITCFRCGMTSYNLQDMYRRYCGNCHVFHEADWLEDRPEVVQ